MKIKLTPELSYLIGFWRKRKTFEGIGVKGEDLHQIFSEEVLQKQLTTSEKLLVNEDRIYFYHTAYRKFFQEIEEDQLERFKYLNEYAANYLAGLFDATGGIDEKGVVFLNKLNQKDEMLFLRLGFMIRSNGDRHVIEKPILFLAFIKNYVKIHKDNKAFELIKKNRNSQ